MDAPYAHIGCCVEDSDASRAALAEARRLRALGPGRLRIVHVVPSPIVYGESLGMPPVEEIAHAATGWLDRLATSIEGAEPVLLAGHPAVAATEWARTAEVDLLVAASCRGLVQRLALGSFASYLAHHAPCPVLLTRPGGAGG